MVNPHEITVVVCLDQRTRRFFEKSLPVWAAYRPELFKAHWLIVSDCQMAGLHEHAAREDPRGAERPVAHITAALKSAGVASVQHATWAPHQQYETQRERMLTAFVLEPPKHVQTDWWLKVDVDALPHDNSMPWFDETWTHPQAEHVMVGAKWGYTKPKHQMEQLDKWAARHPQLKHYEPLNLPYDPDSNKCKHARIASWICLLKTEFTREAAALARTGSEERDRIPVPSQDGYHWYIAALRKQPIIRTNWKRRGWGNYSNEHRHAERAQELLQAARDKRAATTQNA